MCYINSIKMRASTRILTLILLLGLPFQGAEPGIREAAQEARPSVPVFSGNGVLFLASPVDGGGIALLPAGSTRNPLPAGPAAAGEPAVLGVSARTAPSGDIGVVWARMRGPLSEIVFSRFRAGIEVEKKIVQVSSLPLYSPDLAFDSESRPWASWIRRGAGWQEVMVRRIGGDQASIVNGPDLPYAVGPKLLVSGDGSVWLFWTGRGAGREHDRIFSSALTGGRWTAPRPLPSDTRYPQTSPSACLDAAGRPRVFWSGYDGEDYEIFSSAWTGSSWADPERITDNADADLSPAAAFGAGGVTTVVWSKTSPAGHAVAAALGTDRAWSGETALGDFSPEPVRSPGLAAFGGRLGLAWTSGTGTSFLSLGPGDIIARGGRPPERPGSAGAPPPFDPDRDENQYTTFGDSITFAEERGYQPALETMIASEFGVARVWNEGLGGETTAEGLIRIDRAITGHESRYLLLMEGTNDVVFLDISMEAAAFDLEEMARRALRAGMLPLLATIIPRKDWRWTTAPFQSRIVELNARIRELAGDMRIPLVDQYGAFYFYPASRGGWTSLLLDDGVHPNPDGFEVMAQTWFAAILALPFPPVNVRAARGTNRLLFYRRPGNVLLWRNSSKLNPAGVVAYRVYRKRQGDPSFPAAPLAAVPFQKTVLEFRYFDSAIDAKLVYEYVITALRADGVEGPCSGLARDNIE